MTDRKRRTAQLLDTDADLTTWLELLQPRAIDADLTAKLERALEWPRATNADILPVAAADHEPVVTNSHANLERRKEIAKTISLVPRMRARIATMAESADVTLITRQLDTIDAAVTALRALEVEDHDMLVRANEMREGANASTAQTNERTYLQMRDAWLARSRAKRQHLRALEAAALSLDVLTLAAAVIHDHPHPPLKTKTQQDRVNEVLDECERRAAESGEEFNRKQMPGKKEDFMTLCHAYDAELRSIRVLDSFHLYLKDCKWPESAGSQPSAIPLYKKLFPEAPIKPNQTKRGKS